MPTDWSESIVIVDLADEPQLSDELSAVTNRLVADGGGAPPVDVIVSMSDVSYLNSSNIAQLLRLRKAVAERGGRLRIAGLADQVWSVMLMTGLDKVFEFATDKATAIASLQLDVR